jgi:DNA-binding Lrp family transcriptional regulator
MTDTQLDEIDRNILNTLQGGFPVCERPFEVVAERLGIEEGDLIRRVGRFLNDGVLSRFGPLYNAERLGGCHTLAALAVPEERFDDVAAHVNRFPEVAHNYRRDHAFNMWFVVSSDDRRRIGEVLTEIETATGLPALNLPKDQEFFLELDLKV